METSNKINILHIHTDNKFVSLGIGFRNSIFSNRIVLLTNDFKLITNADETDNVEKLLVNKKNLHTVVNYANKSDLVVLYGLDTIKSYLSIKVNKKIPIVWRFFGMELYGKMGDYVFSVPTKRIALAIKKELKLSERLSFAYASIKLFGLSYRSLESKARQRVDAVMMLYKDEYDFLSIHFKLPPFIQIPWSSYDTNKILAAKKASVLIGNSRNRYNNHIEIIESINIAHNSDIEFILPFNYGENTVYSDYVLSLAEKNPHIKILKDFVPFDEYSALINTCSALVINSYRQMAVGNICKAINNGLKIYLSKKNSMFYWLIKEGIKVSTIEDFYLDIKTGNVALSVDDAKQNLIALNNLSIKYNKDEFVKSILKFKH